MATIWLCTMAPCNHSFLSAFFHCTIQVNFGTIDDNVTVSQLFLLSSAVIMGLCSVPCYSRNHWVYMTIYLIPLFSELQITFSISLFIRVANHSISFTVQNSHKV